MSKARKERGKLHSPGKAWLLHHRESLGASTRRLLRDPLSTTMTVTVIAIALALPNLFLLLSDQARQLLGQWDDSARINLYLHTGLDASRIEQLAQELGQRPAIKGVEIILPQEALEEFRQRAGFGEAVDLLGNNPLPPTLLLFPDTGLPAETLAALAESLQALEEVDNAQLDLAWLIRWQAILGAVENGVRLVAILLAVAVAFIIGNTIRLEIRNREEEIVVTKLIGATDAFIRRPLLYSGLLYGLTGGFVGLLLLYLFLALLNAPLTTLAATYQSDFRLAFPGLGGSLGLLLSGAGLGLAGALLSVQRHLHRIQPR